MKKLKIFAGVMMVLTMVCVMSSCRDYKMDVGYSACMSSVSGSIGITSAATNYLKTNGAYIGDKVYSVNSTKSESDCYSQADALAKADYEKSISNLKVEEGQAFLQPGESFSYSWERYEDGNRIVIGEWKCANPAN